jgi:hypothetical protein
MATQLIKTISKFFCFGTATAPVSNEIMTDLVIELSDDEDEDDDDEDEDDDDEYVPPCIRYDDAVIIKRPTGYSIISSVNIKLNYPIPLDEMPYIHPDNYSRVKKILISFPYNRMNNPHLKYKRIARLTHDENAYILK